MTKKYFLFGIHILYADQTSYSWPTVHCSQCAGIIDCLYYVHCTTVRRYNLADYQITVCRTAVCLQCSRCISSRKKTSLTKVCETHLWLHQQMNIYNVKNKKFADKKIHNKRALKKTSNLRRLHLAWHRWNEFVFSFAPLHHERGGTKSGANAPALHCIQ